MPKTSLYMDDPRLQEIRLTPAERSLLRRASVLLGKIRELRADADDDFTTDVALAHHVCLEIASAEWIEGLR